MALWLCGVIAVHGLAFASIALDQHKLAFFLVFFAPERIEAPRGRACPSLRSFALATPSIFFFRAAFMNQTVRPVARTRVVAAWFWAESDVRFFRLRQTHNGERRT
jgi:hypothetical protein